MLFAPPPVQVRVTGEITALSPSRVAVGRMSCAVPARLASAAGRFVVSDSVRIVCSAGELRAIVYVPEVAANQSGRASTVPIPQLPPPRVPTTTPGKVAYSAQTITLGATTTTAYAATGTIDDLSESSVTAGGLTCTISPSFEKFLAPLAHLGDHVTIACNGDDALLRIATVTVTQR
jgi:hypothetical protein